MEPTEYGDCVDAAVRFKWTWNRLLVPEGLVRTRFVVEADVLGDDPPEMILTAVGGRPDRRVPRMKSAAFCA